jgi:hypothetical protein
VSDVPEGLYLAYVEPVHAGTMVVTFPDRTVKVPSQVIGALVKSGDAEVLADGRLYLSMPGAVKIRSVGERHEGVTVWEDKHAGTP